MELNEVVFFKIKQTRYALRYDDIIYMEKRARTITIYTVDGGKYRFYGKYDEVEPMLDFRFTHPHESFVINMQQIYRLGRNEAVMFTGERIELGNLCFGRLKRDYDAYIVENIRNRPGMR